METRIKYRFSIVRFMPNQVRGEFVNVGIVLHVLDTQQLLSRWLPELGRMRCLSPSITFEQYDHFRKQVAERYKEGESYATLLNPDSIYGEPYTKASPELLDYLHREWSVPFQFSEPVAGFTRDPLHQLEVLYRQLVEPLQEEESVVTDSRLERIRRKVQFQLKKDDLLGPEKFKQKIEVPGKNRSWPFDFGHLNGSATLLQVVPLTQKDPVQKGNASLILVGHVRDVRQRDYLEVNTYAIIQTSEDPARMDGIDQARTIIENDGIRTLTVEEVPKITGDLRRKISAKTYSLFTAGQNG
jgi:hypothetical protein